MVIRQRRALGIKEAERVRRNDGAEERVQQSELILTLLNPRALKPKFWLPLELEPELDVEPWQAASKAAAPEALTPRAMTRLMKPRRLSCPFRRARTSPSRPFSGAKSSGVMRFFLPP